MRETGTHHSNLANAPPWWDASSLPNLTMISKAARRIPSRTDRCIKIVRAMSGISIVVCLRFKPPIRRSQNAECQFQWLDSSFPRKREPRSSSKLDSGFRRNDGQPSSPPAQTILKFLLPQFRHLYRTSFVGREVGGKDHAVTFKCRVEIRQWHRLVLPDAVDEGLELGLIGMVFDVS